MRLGGQIIYGLWMVHLMCGAVLLTLLGRRGLLLRYAGLAAFLTVHLARGIALLLARYLESPEAYSALFLRTNWVTLASLAVLAGHTLWTLARPFPRPAVPALAVGALACAAAGAVGWVISSVGLSKWNSATAEATIDLRNWSTAALLAVAVGHGVAGLLGPFSRNQRTYLAGVETYFAVRLVERGLQHAASNEYLWSFAVSGIASLGLFLPLLFWARLSACGEVRQLEAERPDKAAEELDRISRTL